MRMSPLSSALPIAALAMALALAGCGKPKSERKLDQLDTQLLANESDAALTGTLADQIVVDPAKAAKAKVALAKPAAKPVPAAPPAPVSVPSADATASAAPAPRFAKVPPPIATTPAVAPAAVAPGPTLGELAKVQATARKPAPAAGASLPPADVGPVSGQCYADLAYGAGWAAKLPPALPVYPGATLGEAAGNEMHGCAVRIVSFSTHEPWRRIAGWYRDRAAKAGWDAGETVRSGAHVVAGTAPDGSAFYLTLTPADGGGTAADMIVSLGH